jgi:transposase
MEKASLTRSWAITREGRPPLERTTEAVVYSLSSHMPIFYRTFPGNIPDSRSLDVILTDLDHAGFKNLLFITDLGYDTIRNLEKYILRGQHMIMCVKTSQKDVAKTINELDDFGAVPKSMEVETKAKLFFKQYDIDLKLACSTCLEKHEIA